MYANRRNFRVLKEIGVEEHDGDVRFFTGMEIRPFRACVMHPAIIIGTVRSLYGRGYVVDTTFHRTHF